MSEDFNDNKTIQAQSSEAISGGGSGIGADADYVRPAEVTDQDLSLIHISEPTRTY